MVLLMVNKLFKKPFINYLLRCIIADNLAMLADGLLENEKLLINKALVKNLVTLLKPLVKTYKPFINGALSKYHSV